MSDDFDIFDIGKFPTSPTALRMMSRISPIYDRSYVGKWIFQVMGQDFDDIRLRFEELRLQAFPETATWGLTYWEQRYGIVPASGQAMEERRRAVLLKRNARDPMTPAKVEYIIQTVTGFSAKVTENVAEYTFAVEIFSDGSNFDVDAVLSKLKQMKPSHQRMIMYLTAAAGVRIKPNREIYPFPYRMAGTYPQANIIAGIQPVSIVNASGGEGIPFPYTFAGAESAGTIPDTNAIGIITGDGMTAAVDTSIARFDFPLCGDDNG